MNILAERVSRAQMLVSMNLISTPQEYMAILNPPNRRLMTVEDWVLAWYISDNEIELFPNAKIAAEIKSSPLYKALE